jgi:hypothetical protein
MLAVWTSTGVGTAFHYDRGDAGKPFPHLERISVLTRTRYMYYGILILKTGEALHLPETGYKLDVRPSDVFSFANRQLHKVDVDPRIAGAEQLVSTL